MHPVTSILIVGTKIEGIICCILSIFWVATVSVVTDSRHGLAVDENGAVSNGNLYYFSWYVDNIVPGICHGTVRLMLLCFDSFLYRAGFVCSITLLVSYLRHVFNVDVAGSIRTRSARLTTWSAQLATSLVVMGASSNFYDNTCGQGGIQPQCKRAVFGIVLGALATLASVGIVGIKIATSKAPFLIESLLALLLVVSYAFGVAFITSQVRHFVCSISHGRQFQIMITSLAPYLGGPRCTIGQSLLLHMGQLLVCFHDFGKLF